MLITNMEKLFVLLSLSTISASPSTSGIQSFTVNMKCKNKLIFKVECKLKSCTKPCVSAS